MTTLKAVRTLIAAAALACVPVASAGPITIMLTDGVNAAVTVPFASDAVAASNVANFAGAIGAWTVNVMNATGGSPLGAPRLDMAMSVSNQGSPTTFIDLFISQTDFSLSKFSQFASFYAGIGGTTSGSVIWELLVDDGNGLFSGVQVASGMNGGTPFSDETVSDSLVDGLFSMTLHVRILHTNTIGLTSFDFEGFAVPEPATIALLGLGLLGWSLSRRR